MYSWEKLEEFFYVLNFVLHKQFSIAEKLVLRAVVQSENLAHLSEFINIQLKYDCVFFARKGFKKFYCDKSKLQILQQKWQRI